jgi:hypothetical protein
MRTIGTQKQIEQRRKRAVQLLKAKTILERKKYNGSISVAGAEIVS